MNESEDEEFFQEEQKLVERFKTNLERELPNSVLLEEYSIMGSKYDALLRQTLKLMKIGDSTQRRLIKTQNELQQTNDKLEKTYNDLKTLSKIGKTITSTL
jgi:hypothetical protein